MQYKATQPKQKYTYDNPKIVGDLTDARYKVQDKDGNWIETDGLGNGYI